MAKIQTKDIARLIAKKKGLSLSDAELYVDTFFSLISEGLLSDRISKVKGLGTFKLVDVRERASVDVNTGERMVIDGHAKLSFQPDATLKELVNKPFSQFDTVVLNDGVDEDALNNVEFKDEKATDNAFAEASTETSVGKRMDNGKDDGDNCNMTDDVTTVEYSQSESEIKKDEEVKSDSPNGNFEDSAVHLVDNSKKEFAPNWDESDSADVVISTSIDGDENEIADELSVKEGENSTRNIPETTLAKEDEGNAEKNLEATPSPESKEEGIYGSKPIASESTVTEENGNFSQWASLLRKVLWSCVGVVAVVAIFFSGYYFGDKRQSSEVVGKQLTVKNNAKINNVAEEQVKKKSKPDTVAAARMERDSVAKPQRKKANVAVKEIDTKDKSAIEKDDKSLSNVSRIVKTGAYVIVGTDKKLTVKKSQTMKSIAKQYLGEGMECYIQLYNGKLEVTEGETINIPKVELKKKAMNKKVS